ncbi:putative transposase [Trichonephila clavipes]|nr:putative transposase [Trichonephila clavipes]
MIENWVASSESLRTTALGSRYRRQETSLAVFLSYFVFIAISVNRFLARRNIPVAPQPPYSPGLSPCDFFLFPKLKNHLKRHHFGTLEKIQTAVTGQLKAIPISEFH